tara:strand:+ start:2245 stop:2484 length:240 start_codon:yes stop_codon:yes gene_type:complete
MTIINSKRTTKFSPKKKQMKLFILYLSAIVLSLLPFVSIANNIKQDLQQRTETIDSVITSYSSYLQNSYHGIYRKSKRN